MNENILRIQKLINKINYTTTLEEDGVLGKITENAISFFYKNIYITEIPKDKKIIIKDLEQISEKKEKSLINCDYITQRIDYVYSHRMCNIASLLTLKSYYNKEKLNPQKDIITMDTFIDSDYDLKKWAEKNGLNYYISNEKLEQVSEVIAIVLRNETEKDIRVHYLSIDEIKKSIGNKNILIAATKLPGYVNGNVNAGHYVVIVGNFDDLFIIHDPYGLYQDGYNKKKDITTKGKYVLIPQSILFGDFGIKTATQDGSKIKNGDNLYRIIGIK